ncbi:hypothetical protein ACEWY4_008135 [Coilia grayii]|uniref:VPS37 C-terminal domain-containing protein n=1 Tax=Coilia grayii TaxID=363190 RepID=A0ABD1KA48_9TELE
MTRSWDLNLNLDRLKFLSVVELRDLLQDEHNIQHMIKASLKFQALKQQKQMLRASNHRLAEVNLSFQPYLSRGKLRLVEGYLELSRMSSEIGRKQNKIEKQHNWTPHTMQALLRKKAVRARDQSEKLLKRFMGQRVSVERFVDSYQFIRKLYHVRLVKNEKIKDLSVHLQNKEAKAPLHCCCPRQAPRHHSEVCSLCGHVGSGMTVPDAHCPLTTYLVKMPYLPPLDCHLCHNSLGKQTPTHFAHPVAGRVCGQPFGCPARPARLHTLQPQPKDNKRDPKC